MIGFFFFFLFPSISTFSFISVASHSHQSICDFFYDFQEDERKNAGKCFTFVFSFIVKIKEAFLFIGLLNDEEISGKCLGKPAGTKEKS